MKALILTRPGELELAQRAAPPEPGPGEALVKIVRAGVCGTDMHAFAGRQPFFSYPRVLGHELGVEVVKVGSGTNRLHSGDRCAVEPYLNCGTCIACRRGKTNCCVKIRVLGVHCDGGFCEYLVVPEVKLHPSAKLTFDQLALVETLGIGAHAVDRAGVENGAWVLVIGLGPIGLATLQFVLAAGGRPIVMDANAQRVEFCQTQLGVDQTITPGEQALEKLQTITGGDLPTVVFDATGNLESMKQAFKDVAHGGKLVFVGLAQGQIQFDDPDFHRRETTLFASRNSRGQDFRRIIDLVEAEKIDTRPWITHRCGLAETTGKFPEWVRPGSGVLKAIIEVA